MDPLVVHARVDLAARGRGPALVVLDPRGQVVPPGHPRVAERADARVRGLEALVLLEVGRGGPAALHDREGRRVDRVHRLLALGDLLVGEEDDRRLVVLGDVEGLDGDREGVRHRGGREHRPHHVAVGGEAGLEEVRLLALRRQPVEGPPRWTFTQTRGSSAIEARPSISVLSDIPGPDVAVMAFLPAKEAPTTAPIPAISSSHWIIAPPYFQTSRPKNCMISDEGVIG